ncbi:DNA repair protein Smf [Gallibacterium anatis]|uniref:DNA-processing protein DprA n=1 Tax=Gallibacterium anatis TaxID=750 RepID=UPI000530F415|nr:DNA-processing protein DprA [Gallibacterium anatis]KGQ50440.1 DNA repair protein Smf [Gallibacterium anatis]
MQTLTTLLRLSLLPNFGAIRIQQLIEQITIETLLTYDKKNLIDIGWNSTQIQAWYSPQQAIIDSILNWQQQAGNHILHYFDHRYPFLLKQTRSAPPLLFVKGNIDVLSSPQIAMVGSRYCSPYGEHYAQTIAGELVHSGITINSGLALGIDGICHRAALDNHGKTIAVLGSGLNQLYPARHKKLAQQILENNGALLSELFPDTPPIAENFPRRNRIISGLSFGTIVIEASQKSGSLITARLALEQNREVFAVPGALDNPLSQGCHHLIKQGAWLIENAQDVLEILTPQISSLMPFTPAMETQTPTGNRSTAQNTIAISPQAKTGYTPPTINKKAAIKLDIPPQHQALMQQLNSATAISPDELSTALNRPIDQILTDLLELEILGAVQQIQGGYIKNIV